MYFGINLINNDFIKYIHSCIQLNIIPQPQFFQLYFHKFLGTDAKRRGVGGMQGLGGLPPWHRF